MDDAKAEQLIQFLKKQQNRLRPLFEPRGTDCYRIFNRSIGGIPLLIDRYGNSLHITQLEEENPEDSDLSEEQIRRIAGALYTPENRVILKSREKLSEHRQHRPLDQTEERFSVRENGLEFLVNLTDYIDTGLFLDHRNTRQMVREESFGKRVLNLFSYTGSFSVYAAAGGADSITTVDLSATYLDWAKENFKANDFLPGMFEFVQADVFSFLKEANKEHRKWDLIILDPPTFSNSRKMERVLDIQKDHEEILRACAPLLSKDGAILFSTNFSKFRISSREMSDWFRMEEITGQTSGEDFAGKHAHRCWRITHLPGGHRPHRTGQRRSSGRSHSAGRQNPSSGRNRQPSRGEHRKSSR